MRFILLLGFFLSLQSLASPLTWWAIGRPGSYSSGGEACNAHIHRPGPFLRIMQSTNADSQNYYLCFFYAGDEFQPRGYQTGVVWHNGSCNGVIDLDTGRCVSSCTGSSFFDPSTNSCTQPLSCAPHPDYDSTVSSCVKEKHKGPPSSCIADGKFSLSIETGNNFQSAIDIGNDMVFFRYFNSADGIWRHHFSVRVKVVGEEYKSVVLASGQEVFFNSRQIGDFSGVDVGVLTQRANGWRYVTKDNQINDFDTTGRLTSWSNLQGESYSLSYANDVVTVVDHKGQQLQFTEDANHQPKTMTAAGVSAVYHYSPQGQLVKVAVTRNGQTTERQYHYEDARNPKLLTGITDERGVRYATWAYDEQGRAIASEHAGGADKVTVAYNADGSSTVTNALGKQTTYRFQTIQGVRRITAIEGEPSANCPNSNSTFAYDERGLLTRKTDNKGNVTTYTYNDRGQEISRTEAAGTPQARTITTEWHPEFFLPSKVTEPGQVTVYTYNEQGREVGRTHSTN